MSHPQVHSEKSARLFGGQPSDYIHIHSWFDASKAWIPEMTHRAMRHHAQGIFECESVFGDKFVNSDGKTVYTRYVGEQHVVDDLGFIPTVSDWLECMDMQRWMMIRDERINKLKNKKAGNRLPTTLAQLGLSNKHEELLTLDSRLRWQ